MALESIPAYATFHGGVAGQAYNQAAFHHFLAIERRRVARSSQSVVLVLVSIRSSPGRSGRLEATTATALFSALGAMVRETDFVGWYREARVAAAVLTQPATAQADARERTAARLTRALHARIPDISSSARVRVVWFGGRCQA